MREDRQNFSSNRKEGYWETVFYDLPIVFWSVYYKDGEPDGDYLQNHINGVLSTKGQYKQGKPYGLWERYYSTGVLIQSEFYAN